jgi:hypothetical protein
MFDHTKTTQSTQSVLKAVLTSEDSPWTCPIIATVLNMMATYGMRDQEMDLTDWSNSPILVDFKTGAPLTDVQHRECVTARQKACGIYKFMNRIRTHQWRKYLTQSWLATGGCGQILARFNNWGKTGDGQSMTEQDTYQIGIEEPMVKHGSGTPLGERYFCPGLQLMELVSTNAGAQGLVVEIANCCLGRMALPAHFWDEHKAAPLSGTYERGRTLKSMLHTIHWMSSLLIARLNQMYTEQPKHWLFTCNRSPIGNRSAKGIAQTLWREAQKEPFDRERKRWIAMSKGKQMSSDDGVKLYGMMTKQSAEADKRHSLVVELLKNVLVSGGGGGGGGTVSGDCTAQSLQPEAMQRQQLEQLLQRSAISAGQDASASAGPTAMQLNNPAYYDTRSNGKSTWVEKRQAKERTYEGHVPNFNRDVLTLHELNSWSRALALYTCDTSERKSMEWMEANAKFWRFKVNPHFNHRFMRWTKAFHLISVLARENKTTASAAAKALDDGDDWVAGSGEYPASFPGQFEYLLCNKKGNEGLHYALQKEYTQIKSKEMKIAREKASKPQPTFPRVRDVVAPVLPLSAPQLPPAQMTLLGSMGPPPAPARRTFVPVSKREGYHRVWAKDVGTMGIPAVAKELSSYKTITGVDITVPEGTDLASFLGENAGEKRKRAQLVLTREFVSKRNGELPWTKKKKT